MGRRLGGLLRPRCDMCGRVVDFVIPVRGTSQEVCSKCKKIVRSSDNSGPYRAPGSAPYRHGQPPRVMPPMGSGYIGPAPKPQQRRKP